MTYASPGVDPRELRPRRAWYGVAAAVVVVCVGIGVAGFLIGLYSTLNSFPQRMDAEFTGSDAAVVELTTGRQAAIYLANPDAPEQVDVECEGRPAGGGGGEIMLVPFGDTLTFMSSGHRWQLIYQITVTETGEYEVRCTSDDPVAADGRFGVTDKVDPAALAAKTVGSLLALIGAPCAGLFLGGVVALVTGLRRSAHRKRLLQERAGTPPAGSPSP